MYQIANIYLVLVTGSLWESLSKSIDNPRSTITIISAALPSVSIFFTNYIITVCLSGVPYMLIRRFRAVQYLIVRFCYDHHTLTRRTLKQEGGAFADTSVGYGTELSDILYVLCIVLLYWVISPVVLICATALFWSLYYAWKYQFVFVITRTRESGGIFWYKLYRYSMTGLMAGAIAFMTFMGIKQGIQQGPMLLPLPFIILHFWIYTDKCFKVRSKVLPYEAAIREDALQQSLPLIMRNEEKLFQYNFMQKPNLVDPAIIYPYPHRIQHIPLLDAFGALNEVYVESIPEGIDPCSIVNTAATSLTTTI